MTYLFFALALLFVLVCAGLASNGDTATERTDYSGNDIDAETRRQEEFAAWDEDTFRHDDY